MHAHTAMRSGRAPGAVPVIGHLGQLLLSPLDFAASLGTHGDLVEIRLGPLRAFVPWHPELLWQVLTDDRTYDKGGLFFTRARRLFGHGLPLCPHSEHRRTRRLMQPGFATDRMATYSTVMEEEIAQLLGGWGAGRWRPGPAGVRP
ncbi:hypothetical protein ACFY7C_36330 [Streptomyces sp. NPDC012769]|uniref:hypothetical protein n=1 Tax=Streptomyces sp. NPDC012769 TaxID=3364848 RepID=UPI00367AAE7E